MFMRLKNNHSMQSNRWNMEDTKERVIEEYHILEESQRNQLEVEVMRLYRKGFAIHGAPFAYTEKEFNHPDRVYFCQAMIKYRDIK